MAESKIYARREYELCDKDLEMLIEAARTPVMMIGSYATDPQASANQVWENIGMRMGFEYMTVRPIPGKHHRFFTAVPSESETERQEREAREAEQKRLNRITELKHQRAQIDWELKGLENG